MLLLQQQKRVFKRTSLRSYAASNGEDYGMKDTDKLIASYEMNTMDVLLILRIKEITYTVRSTYYRIYDGKMSVSMCPQLFRSIGANKLYP